MDRKYRTLGGWLIVVQVFLILKAISWLRNVQIFMGLMDEKDTLIKTMDINDPSLYNIFVYYEFISSAIFLIFCLALVYYMFKRSKYFPGLVYIFLASELVLDIISAIIFTPISKDNSPVVLKLGIGFIVALIIFIYILRSERVKLTFVE